MPSSPPQPLSPIPFIGMTRQRFTPGRALDPPRVLVIHATAGRHPGDLGWLSRGGGDPPLSPVSCNYYIDAKGAAVQLVRDDDTAWHTGPAAWTVDGAPVSGSHQGVARLNHLSIGIELSNLNTGHDPYPAPQVAAAIALARHLVALHQIPRHQLVRHLDISPGRKSDPAGFPWRPFVEAVYADTYYHAASPLLGPALGTQAAAVAWFAARSTQYDHPAIATIVGAYDRIGTEAGVDWFLALAQCAHETGNLSSWWCARPRRNPAGIGVTGDARMGERPGQSWAYDPVRDVWLEGCSFPRWDGDAVRAHLGRLLGYALPVGAGTPAQRALIEYALTVRPLPDRLRGVATTISDLNGRWAVPGIGYGGRVAHRAEIMRGDA